MQDFQRISREPTLDGIEDKSTFQEKIDSERVWAAIRKHNAYESGSLSKAADPGKLKKQREWIAWSRKSKELPINNYWAEWSPPEICHP